MRLLVSPLAPGAYFASWPEVAAAELGAHFPGLAPRRETVGGLELIDVDLDLADAPALARLSFVQGMFTGSLEGLVPVAVAPDFRLHDDWVYGSKYQGKTNELVTRLAINLALRHSDRDPAAARMTLLDPMAGQGTTLLWAMRYGLDARGIEREARALDGLRNHLGRQTRRHRIRHELDVGHVGPARRDPSGTGRFLRIQIADRSLQLVIGDSAQAPELLARQRFDLLVTDLPYGIQHRGGGARRADASESRDVLATVRACAPAWVNSLQARATIVLIFNAYQSKREELAAVFTDLGCEAASFTAPHRMSESIVRDLLVLRAP